MASEHYATQASFQDLIESLDRRITQLENHYRPTYGNAAWMPYVFHFMADPLTVETSDDLPVPVNGPVRVWVARLRTAGSGDTSVDLQLDGTVIATAVVPSGALVSAPVRLGKPASLTQRLTADLTAVGSGALGLVCCAAQLGAVI